MLTFLVCWESETGEMLSEEARPTRCFFRRATHEPRMEPATVEVLGRHPTLLSEKHAY